jgi:ATP-dependent DNA helicase RecG
MALPININDVLHGRSVEWERLEFKRNWNPEPVLHTLCAFANDFHNIGGGYLLIGVAERDGRPVLPPIGLDPTTLDSLQKQVLKIGHKIVPAYHPLMEPTVIEGRHILILRAPGGQSRPYKAPESLSKDNKTFRYYIRKGSSTVRAGHEEEIELLSMAAQIPFDDRMNQQSSLADLSLPLRWPFCVMSAVHLLRKPIT